MQFESLPALSLLAYFALSALVALLRHPGDARGVLPAVLRALGALSCLRFRDAPGPALSVPLLPQRAPDPDEPTEGALLAMGGAAERAYVAAGGIVGIPGGPLGEQPLKARRAWASACAAAMGEWRRLRALRDFGLDLPHDPAVPPLPPRSGTIITSVALLVALGLTACAGGWRASLARCGLAMAPAGVESGVALALRGGEGWAEALGRLVGSYGECVVKAEVQRHADGLGPEPPSARAHALTVEGAGELAARPVAAVDRETAQGRARLALAGWGDVVKPVRREGPL